VNEQFPQSGAAKTQQILTDTSLMLIGSFDKPTQGRTSEVVILKYFFAATHAYYAALLCDNGNGHSTGCVELPMLQRWLVRHGR
jgi:hypothetical protein